MRTWTFVDEIHFVNEQLDHYYGVDNWPRRFCSEIVNCSDSTHRKYSNQDWALTWEEYDYIHSLFDFSQREIKKLIWDDDKYKYYAGKGRIIKKAIDDIPNPKNLIEDPTPLLIKAKPDYNYIYPDKSGLYMLAEIVSPANRPNEQYYLIKIGQSTNLKNRINSYKGMNPFACCIDTLLCPSKDLDALELYWHDKLAGFGGHSQAGTEWYVMPKDRYEKLIELGFKYK